MTGPKYPKVVGKLVSRYWIYCLTFAIGYDLVKQIGGGAFSTWVLNLTLIVTTTQKDILRLTTSVFEAVNVPEHRVAACKVILLTESTTEKERKTVEKEMRVHAALKHQHVLEFLNAVVVELKHQAIYVPGIYMLIEYAGGGDLFDKIGTFFGIIYWQTTKIVCIAPDIGVDEDLAHYYFLQLISGMVKQYLFAIRMLLSSPFQPALHSFPRSLPSWFETWEPAARHGK